MSYLLAGLVNTAHAQTATSADDFAQYAITQFHAQFWGPFGVIVGLGILIALVGMVYRRVRGTARRPK